MALRAWAFVDADSDLRACCQSWFNIAGELLDPIVDEARNFGRLSFGGAFDDVARNVYHKKFSGHPDLELLSFQPGTNFDYSIHARHGETEFPLTTRTTLRIDDDGHLDLECSASGTFVSRDDIGQLLSDLVRRFSSFNPVMFANVSPDTTVGRTALENLIRRHKYPTARDEAVQVLRGYSWTTVVPPSLAEHVEKRLIEDPRLEVTRLERDALYIRAGQTFSDYTEALQEALFVALAPILPAGKPRKPSMADRYQVVYRDARDVASFYAEDAK